MASLTMGYAPLTTLSFRKPETFAAPPWRPLFPKGDDI